MGNLFAESGLIPNNLQNTYNASLGMSDVQYTAAVDNVRYNNFANDAAGYGLAQWTYHTRKKALLAYAQKTKKSIGDLEMQLGFLINELSTEFSGVFSTLKTATSILQASNAVLFKFECPADQSTAIQTARASYGQKYYDKYKGTSSAAVQTANKTATAASSGYTAATVVALANAEVGYREKASNSQLESKTANAGSNNWNKFAADIDKNHPDFYNGKKNGYDWCDIFNDDIHIRAAGGDAEIARKGLYQPKKSTGAGCPFSAQFYRDNNAWIKRGGTPLPGDQIFFGPEGDEYHTGIVVKVTSSTVYTVEGNSSEMVAARNYSRSYSEITGYGRPKYLGSSSGSAAKTTTTPKKSVTDIAKEVIAGKWGNGEARKTKLTAAGYSYSAVQAKVNEILKGNTATAASTYTVKRGDTLSGIAKDKLGNWNRYTEIMKLNGLTGTTIYPGQTLKIPKR